MNVFAELFKSQIGILATLTIFLVIVIATFMFLWVRKQANAEEATKK